MQVAWEPAHGEQCAVHGPTQCPFLAGITFFGWETFPNKVLEVGIGGDSAPLDSVPV